MDFDIWQWNQSVWFCHLEWILNWKSFTLTEIRDIDSMSVLLVKRLSKSQCRGPTRNRFFFLSLCPFSRYFLFFFSCLLRRFLWKEVNPAAQSLQAGMFWASKLLTHESERFLWFQSYYTFKQNVCRGGKEHANNRVF